MAIFLPGTAEELELSLEDLTPREIVAELDKHVVGQRAAKRGAAKSPRGGASACAKKAAVAWVHHPPGCR